MKKLWSKLALSIKFAEKGNRHKGILSPTLESEILNYYWQQLACHSEKLSPYESLEAQSKGKDFVVFI